MRSLIAALLSVPLALTACNTPDTKAPASRPAAAPAPSPMPPIDDKNIVSIATGSKDHTTLVAALKAADYVASVANPGPLTVFAPTNAAFDKLPKGTVEGLLQPDKIEDLRNVLKYHVTPAVYETKFLTDGQSLGMVNGQRATVHRKGEDLFVNDARIVASVRASNGIVHIIDGVLLPPPR